MKHILIFTVFFLTFTLASLLIATPLFPGNFLLTILSRNAQLMEYSRYIVALINGLIYSLLISFFFVWLSKKLVED
jgi:large-conductance mechanosensitive channel